MSDFFGDGGDNSITGTADPDVIDITQGGEDTALGMGGDDQQPARSRHADPGDADDRHRRTHR